MSSAASLGGDLPPAPLPFDVLLIELAEPYFDLQLLGRVCLADSFHNKQLRLRLRRLSSASTLPAASLAPAHDEARPFLSSLSVLQQLVLYCTKLGTTPLPPALTGLTLHSGSVLSDFSSLPSTLTHLDIPVRPMAEDALGALPRGLVSLSVVLREVDQAQFVHLPPHLRSLRLDSYTCKPSLSVISSAATFPSTLRVLHLGHNLTIALSALVSLPGQLSELVIEGRLQKPRSSDKVEAPFFPPTLTSLAVRVKPLPDARRREWPKIIALKLPEALMELEFDDGPSDGHQSDELAFEALPSSLRALRVPNRKLHSSTLGQLPAPFRSLHCSPVPWLDSSALEGLHQRGVEVALSVQ